MRGDVAAAARRRRGRGHLSGRGRDVGALCALPLPQMPGSHVPFTSSTTSSSPSLHVLQNLRDTPHANLLDYGWHLHCNGDRLVRCVDVAGPGGRVSPCCMVLMEGRLGWDVQSLPPCPAPQLLMPRNPRPLPSHPCRHDTSHHRFHTLPAVGESDSP